jgi:hypothetical protein
MYSVLIKIRIFLLRISSSPLLIIEINNGIPRKIMGNVKNSFLADCIEICERNNLGNGFLYTTKSEIGHPVLKGSYEISSEALQQFRNTWGSLIFRFYKIFSTKTSRYNSPSLSSYPLAFLQIPSYLPYLLLLDPNL